MVRLSSLTILWQGRKIHCSSSIQMKPALLGTHYFPLGFYMKEEIVILFIMLNKVVCTFAECFRFFSRRTAAMCTALIDGQEQELLPYKLFFHTNSAGKQISIVTVSCD